MLFNSVEFGLFFPLVFLVYWLIPNKLKLQNYLLLIASYFFYAWWDWRFLGLIIFSSTVDYLLALGIEKFREQNLKLSRLYLNISLATNLGLLGVFKYFNFFADSFVDLAFLFGLEVDSVTLNIILPVGISFYTFQTMSYSIDVYRGNFKATKDVVTFFTYVSFFPQLVAGPIERARELIPQIKRKRVFEIEEFKSGIIQIVIGLFRKMVIADNLGVYVDMVYQNPENYGGGSLVLATVFYGFQIYYDFSGYSDIAIGTAKLLGFNFNRNFNLPYFSKSVTEFWRRWHISLSSWLKDYLYISLGGNRRGVVLQIRNLFITMLLGGLWHGASWNFVIWGGIHASFLAMEKVVNIEKINQGYSKYLWWFYTMLVVFFAWIFFRAQTSQDAFSVISGIAVGDFNNIYLGSLISFYSGISMLIIGLAFDLYLFKSNQALEDLGRGMSLLKFVFIVTIFVNLIVLFYSSSENFIYFQF